MKKKGFTLVELLAVIAILAILVLIVLPQVLVMFRKSRDDTFLIEARAIMNAAEKKLAQEIFDGDVSEKIYCSSAGEIVNELDTSGRQIFYLIYVKNSKIVMYAISDNTEHTVFNIDEENGLTSKDITELYENVIEIKDCDLDYILASKGINPEDQYDWVTYNCDDQGNCIPIKVPYSGFTGYSCQTSNIEPSDASLFDFDLNTKTLKGFQKADEAHLKSTVKSLIIPCKIKGVRVEKIADNAFSNGILEYLYMPDTVKTIGTNAFYNNKLHTISLGNSLSTIGCGAFSKNSLSHVMLPRGLTTLGTSSCSTGVFQNNPSLDVVKFQSNAITMIGAYTFYNTKLSTIDLSSQNKLETIGKYAFANNRNLGAIRFATSITSIGDYAFLGSGLKSIYLSSSKGVTVGQEAFADNSISKITMSGVKSLGPNAFRNNQMPDNQAYVMNVDSSGKETSVLNSYAGSSRNNLTFPAKVKDISQVSFKGMGLTGTLDTGDSVTEVPGGTKNNGAFYGNSIAKVRIGKSVKTIGAYAFQGNKIYSIDFADGVLEKIACGAFYSNKVENIVLPDSLITFGESCSYGPFEGNSSLKTIKFGRNLESIGNYAFYNNKLETVDFSVCSKLKSIGNYAFKNNQLKKVLLNGTSLSVGSDAFMNNKIEEVEIYGTNHNFSSNVFRSNIIKKLKIDGSGIKIGSEVFANNKLEEFSMNGVVSIGSNAFRDNQMPPETAFIMNVDSSGNPTSSLNSYGGKERNNITIPSNVRTIAAGAFENLGLTGTVNLGNLTSIPQYAFAHNKLTSINLSNITSLGANAFKDNSFPDSTAFIMNIVNGETTTELNSYAGAKRENIVIPNNITKITGNNFYYYESNMPSFYIKGSLTIGDGIKEIPATAFYVQNITKLILGSNVETIDYGAFYSNSSLSEIVFNNKLKTIKRGAFQSCTALTSLNFPDSLETIEGANNSSHFKTYKKDPYNYPNTLGYWLSYGYDGFGAFARCTGLTSVSFGSGIKNVGVSAFHGDSKLATINTDRIAGLATFDDFAFYGTKITKFTVPSSVKVIEDRVLAGISTLNEIYIKGKAELEEFDHLGIEWNGVCNNIKFEVESCFTQSGGKITSYNNSCSKNAKIPDTIDNVKIKGIASGAFNGSNLVSVYIPSAIKTIDAGAFTNSNIEYIMAEGKTNSSDFTTADSNWNNGIHVIYSKNQLTCLKIDDNNIIQGYYFGAPNNICNREIDLPNTIKGATENALQGGVIKSIKVADGARFTTMGEGWSGSASYVQFLGDSYDYNCFTLDGSTITKYRNFCKPTVDLSTNNGMVQGVKITKIGANAFKETGITSFKFTDDITEVGDNAFSGNYELSQVTFVNAVNNDSSNLFKVGNEAFYNCDLVSVNLPGSLKIVGDRAFDDNIRLSSIIVLNKTSLNEFESLGERWNGDCTKITFQRNR